ncbi:hypothetical protein DIPPA_35591 [Diplonema papillatum]|nr:hypothetical protein DIPPA_35591 [Diplonema papillatum]|eukprot:gene17457-26833_t
MTVRDVLTAPLRWVEGVVQLLADILWWIFVKLVCLVWAVLGYVLLGVITVLRWACLGEWAPKKGYCAANFMGIDHLVRYRPSHHLADELSVIGGKGRTRPSGQLGVGEVKLAALLSAMCCSVKEPDWNHDCLLRLWGFPAGSRYRVKGPQNTSCTLAFRTLEGKLKVLLIFNGPPTGNSANPSQWRSSAARRLAARVQEAWDALFAAKDADGPAFDPFARGGRLVAHSGFYGALTKDAGDGEGRWFDRILEQLRKAMHTYDVDAEHAVDVCVSGHGTGAGVAYIFAAMLNAAGEGDAKQKKAAETADTPASSNSSRRDFARVAGRAVKEVHLFGPASVGDDRFCEVTGRRFESAGVVVCRYRNGNDVLCAPACPEGVTIPLLSHAGRSVAKICREVQVERYRSAHVEKTESLVDAVFSSPGCAITVLRCLYHEIWRADARGAARALAADVQTLQQSHARSGRRGDDEDSPLAKPDATPWKAFQSVFAADAARSAVLPSDVFVAWFVPRVVRFAEKAKAAAKEVKEGDADGGWTLWKGSDHGEDKKKPGIFHRVLWSFFGFFARYASSTAAGVTRTLLNALVSPLSFGLALADLVTGIVSLFHFLASSSTPKATTLFPILLSVLSRIVSAGAYSLIPNPIIDHFATEYTRSILSLPQCRGEAQ